MRRNMEPILGIFLKMSSRFLCNATSYDCLLNNGLRLHFFVVELHSEMQCTSMGRKAQTLSVVNLNSEKVKFRFE